MAQQGLRKCMVQSGGPDGAAFVAMFEDHVIQGDIAAELSAAYAYVGTIGGEAKFTPLGVTCAEMAPKKVYEAFQAKLWNSVTFSGTLWNLDLAYRLMPVDQLDVSRMRWALESMAGPGQINKALGSLVVRAETVTNAPLLEGCLQKVERDADLDAIILAVYWMKPSEGALPRPLLDQLRDMVLRAEPVGSGVEASIERFLRYEEEEKKRNVMGLSAYRRALELKQLVLQGAAQRAGKSDAKLASDLLGSRDSLKASWTEDTCRRYLNIADRFDQEGHDYMNRWEMKFGRSAFLDQLHLMRSATTAAQTPAEMTLLIKTFFWEQSCGVRSVLGQRGRAGAGDATAMRRGVLLRHVFFKYIRAILPKLQDTMTTYGTYEWYKAEYGMDEKGNVQIAPDADSDEEGGEGEEKNQENQTRFESKRKVHNLLTSVAKGKHDYAFKSLAQVTGMTMALDLSCDGMKTIQKQVSEIFTLYQQEFPKAPTRVGAGALPSAELDSVDSAGVYAPALVKGTNRIETEDEYRASLSKYADECRRAQEESVREFVEQRAVLIIADLEPSKISKKLERVTFMKEPGRKLFLYDSMVHEPLNWTKLRKLKRSFLTSAKVNVRCSQPGQPGEDTLSAVKDIYLSFRAERSPDNVSEDIAAAIVPGMAADVPKNDALDAAWRSLKALGRKHIGPKIGTIQMNKSELLQQVYTRGTWSRTPDHHLAFTYQAAPRHDRGRKRMKYLMDGPNHGDAAFNVWPAPMIPIASMPKVTTKVHDDIFQMDSAVDSGEDDGAGSAAVHDLGDDAIPFPREYSEKLAREMIFVWGIDVGVIFTPGTGKSLLAFIMENKRAVGIVKNKAHKDLVMQCLSDVVKNQNMAPDARPAKPEALTVWESTRGNAPRGNVSAGPAGEGAATIWPAPPAQPPPVSGATGAQSAGVYAPAAAKAATPTAPSLPQPLIGGPPPTPNLSPMPKPSPTPNPATAAAPAVAGLAGFGASALR